MTYFKSLHPHLIAELLKRQGYELHLNPTQEKMMIGFEVWTDAPWCAEASERTVRDSAIAVGVADLEICRK